MPPAPRRHPSLSRWLVVTVVSTCAALLSACATAPLPPTVAQTPIDLPRFMGRWHVIAHVPYFAEAGHVASSDTYTLQDDGGIAVRYTYREGFGEPVQTFDSRATVREGTGNRQWTTWFYRVVPTKFRILEVAPGGSVVWEYVNPFFVDNPRLGGRHNILFRAHRYEPDSPELEGRDLDPARYGNLNRLYADA